MPRRPHSGDVELCIPPRACPAPCSPGHDSYGISRRIARHPRKPGGRDLTEVALSGPPMTHPDTIRPHQGPKIRSYFFSIIACELRAPLRNRTVDLLLTMEK
jgi:hypothetical protein